MIVFTGCVFLSFGACCRRVFCSYFKMFIYYLIVCVGACCLHIRLCNMWVTGDCRVVVPHADAEEGATCPVAGVAGSCKLPHGYWELNPSPPGAAASVLNCDVISPARGSFMLIKSKHVFRFVTKLTCQMIAHIYLISNSDHSHCEKETACLPLDTSG